MPVETEIRSDAGLGNVLIIRETDANGRLDVLTMNFGGGWFHKIAYEYNADGDLSALIFIKNGEISKSTYTYGDNGVVHERETKQNGLVIDSLHTRADEERPYRHGPEVWTHPIAGRMLVTYDIMGRWHRWPVIESDQPVVDPTPSPENEWHPVVSEIEEFFSVTLWKGPNHDSRWESIHKPFPWCHFPSTQGGLRRLLLRAHKVCAKRNARDRSTATAAGIAEYLHSPERTGKSEWDITRDFLYLPSEVEMP